MKTILEQNFKDNFNLTPTHFISCGGRFEILGNHTDHNHGKCLAATCNLSIKSAVSKKDDLTVRLVSKGNPSFEISLEDLSIQGNEKFTSQGLIRGVAFYLKDKGYNIGGFNVYMESDIFAGAGVSSSAAFELLVAQIFNELFNNNSIDKIVLCKAGQFAENNYFGKKSGLLDQIGVCYGGIVYIDFEDIANPVVDSTQIDFKDLHYVIVNTGGSHADLSDAYSAIPNDMYSAAKKCGHNFLIEGSLEEIEAHKAELSEMEYNRAIHFYSETRRVEEAKLALINNDEETFISKVNESRLSSTNYLKNMMVGDDYVGSPLEACDLAMEIIGEDGACKINGGGFAGSIICLVKENKLKEFINKMKAKYGDHNVVEVFVRPIGPSVF